MKTSKKKTPKNKEITDYDAFDTSRLIDSHKAMKLKDLGIDLPLQPPTQVVSIRLPTSLLNRLRALGSQQDVPYQALIKLFLAQAVEKSEKHVA